MTSSEVATKIMRSMKTEMTEHTIAKYRRHIILMVANTIVAMIHKFADMFLTQRMFISNNPTKAGENGAMYNNFKDYVHASYPNGVREEDWDRLEVRNKICYY